MTPSMQNAKKQSSPQKPAGKPRLLTGDRTTGRLHLGHYVGSLQARVQLQNDYSEIILLADVQALTTHFQQPELIRQSIYDVALDNLAAGLDPQRVLFAQQSRIGPIAELTVFYSMLVTVNTLRHNPTIKTEAAQYGYQDMTYGFLGYPVSQAADITFCSAQAVPVGEDQLPHLELCRKLVRRFADLYGPVLTEPQPLLSACPRLKGLDGGGKMGKSLGNAVYLSDPPTLVEEKTRRAVTDPHRITAREPGDPAVCVVSQYHQIFNAEEYEEICSACRNGCIGCVACKNRLTRRINALLEPMRERRAYYEAHLDVVRELIDLGSRQACRMGEETVRRVRDAMQVAL